MGRNFDDYPGFQPFRSWANTYAQDCKYIELPEKMSNWLIKLPLSFKSKRPIHMCPKVKKLLDQIFSEFLLNADGFFVKS